MEGSPADCVKIGVFEFCPRRPDLIVSGINGGLNAGINVLYSGTVAAAIEGAFLASRVSPSHWNTTSRLNLKRRPTSRSDLIEQLLAQKPPAAKLYNINIPTAATRGPAEVRMVPMGLERYGQNFLKRQDPKGRTYYWASGEPPPAISAVETDLTALKQGHITVTPLGYDRTQRDDLGQMQSWRLRSPTCP